MSMISSLSLKTNRSYSIPNLFFRYVNRFIGLLLFLLFGGIFLISCDQDQEAVKVDLDKRRTVQAKKKLEGVTYAYLPQYSHKISYKRHHPLVEYLRQKTDLNIRQVFPDTFDEHVKMVGQGKIDISFSNPFIYIKIAEEYGARAFARIVEENGRSMFRGQIICRQDNKAIRTLNDCRGKSWIAVDPASAGGYLFPLGHFLRHGITRKDFREISFAPGPGGKQEKVVIAVYLGEYDIGSIREGTLDLVQNRIDTDKINVLARTAWYPGWVYAARQGLDRSLVDRIKQAMLELDKDKKQGQKILEQAGFKGIIPARDKDFDPVRELARALARK